MDSVIICKAEMAFVQISDLGHGGRIKKESINYGHVN